MYVIAIIGQKGGTGKTTIAIALAAQAAKAGRSSKPKAQETDLVLRRAQETL
jgi:cellulose biosynthesis protein BcsQ